MAGAFHHDLHILCPGPLGQLAQPHQLLDLAHVAAVGKTPGAAGVAQRNGHIILPADIQNFVKILVEGVFLPGHAHPREHQRAAPGDNVHLPLVLFDLVDGLAGDAAVQCHEVHAVLSMKPYHVNEILGGQGGEVTLVVDDAVVNRHGADHGRALGGELPAEGLGVAVGGQVHDGLGPHVDSRHDLLHFNVIVLAVPGHAQIHVDLGAQHGADTVGVDAGMQLIGADRHLTFGYQLPNFFGCAVFLFCHGFHFRGDITPPGGFHLGCVISHNFLPFKRIY